MIAPNTNRLSEPTLVDTVRNTWGVVSRQRRKAGLFVLAVLTIVAGWLVFAPRKYESAARLFVKVGRESVTLDPTATTGSTISIYESREVEINSVLDLLSSRVILERVVDDLGAQTILGREPDGGRVSRSQFSAGDVEPGGNASSGKLNSGHPTPALRERAVRQLEDTVRTAHSRKSSVIDVTARAASPELAQRILASFLRAFHGSYLEANRTSGSYEFFVRQAELLSAELQQATDELSAAKNAIHLISIDEQRRTVQAQISDVEAQRLAAETALATSMATIAELRKLIDDVPQRLVTQTVAGFPDGADGQTRRQLYELEIRERELLTKYTEHHPLVKAAREQIAAARRILTQDDAVVEQTTLAVHPARQQLELQLLNEQAQAVAWRARVAALAVQHETIAGRLRDLNDREGHIARLEQKVELLKASHKSYAEKREQARIDQALVASQITNVNVVQPPTYVSRPVAPSKRLVAALGLFVACVGAVGLAFACEYLPPVAGCSDVVANGNGRIPYQPTENHTHDVREASQLVEDSVG